MKYQVYRIVNLINNKVYIGRSKDASKRFKSHEYTANGNRGYKLHHAIRKYGIDNFRLDIIIECDSLEESVEKEEYFIKISNSFKMGYNSSKGGLGEMRSEYSYAELSKKLKGRKFSEKHKENISKAKKGKKLSIKRRMSMIKPLNRKQWNDGKKLTEKQKKKQKGMKRRPSRMVELDGKIVFFSLIYLAEYIGTRPENITRWLNGTRKNTSGHVFKEIGEVTLCDYKIRQLYI